MYTSLFLNKNSVFIKEPNQYSSIIVVTSMLLYIGENNGISYSFNVFIFYP